MYIFASTLSLILSCLPLPVLSAMAHTLAFISFRVLRIRRRLVLDNIGIAFGDSLTSKEKESMGYASVYHFYLTVLEFFHEREGKLGVDVPIEGSNALEKALERGEGAYILCMHLGSWEAMGGAVTHGLRPAHVIVKNVGSKGLNRFFNERRKKNGFYVIERKHKGDAVRGIQKVLKKGDIVGFVMDQARPGSPRLPFFGKLAKTNTSFSAIWRRNPAPIFMSYAIRVGTGKHKLHVLPEITLPCTEDLHADILQHSLYLNTLLEACIRANPEQYFWMHNRWKG